MNHPREPFERLFDGFNECFASIAEREGFRFDNERGHVRRSLRLPDDPLKRGVFLELKQHILNADPVDPQIILAYGAWHYPKPHSFPFHYLCKVFYEGGLTGLRDCMEEKLTLAASEIKTVTQEMVIREGKVFTDWPKDASEGGQLL